MIIKILDFDDIDKNEINKFSDRVFIKFESYLNIKETRNIH